MVYREDKELFALIAAQHRENRELSALRRFVSTG
jgi:hypothetical protein